jgi:hypothetical protein
MAKQRLFPEPISVSTNDDPNQRLDALARKVFSVSKDEIDKRENQWKRARKRPKRPKRA